MGTDIAGWVEVDPAFDAMEPFWREVVDIGAIVGRSYDLYGCLFGVRNYARFRPLFPNRGLPEGSAVAARYPGDEAAHSATWFTFAELQRIDPREAAEGPDDRIHEFVVQPDGSEKFDGKSVRSPHTEPHRAAVMRDGVVRLENRVLRAVTLRRGDVLDDVDWPVIVRMMSVLAERYGSERVRGVVWFDD